MPSRSLPIPRTGYLCVARTDRPNLLRKSTHGRLVVPPDWLFRSHEGQKESGTMGSFARTAGAWKRTLLFAVGALLVMAAASRPRRRPPTDTDVRIEQPRKSPQAGDVTSDRPRD